MIAAMLAGPWTEASAREARRRAGTTNVDDGSQVLLLLQRRRTDAVPEEDGPATCRSRYADVISTACDGITRMYRLLNQHESKSCQGPSSTTL